MADLPNNDRKEPDAAGKVKQAQTPKKPGEMSDDELEKVSGGVTMQDFNFTKKIDKTSPT